MGTTNTNLRPSARINEKGIIEEVNLDYCELLGYTEEEMVGERIAKFRGNEFPQVIQVDLEKTLLKAEPYNSCTIERKKDGTPVYLSMTLLPNGTKGDYKGYIAIKRELTNKEKTQAEERIRGLNSGKLQINAGTIKPSTYMNTIGRVFKLRSLPMMAIAASVTTAAIMGGAFTYQQVQTTEVTKNSIQTFSTNAKDKLTELVAQNVKIGETNASGLMGSHIVRQALQGGNHEVLSASFEGIDKHYKNTSSIAKMKMQIIDKNGNSVFRSWDKSQKPVSVANRGYIKKSLKNKANKTFNVVSKGGFGMRSISPVYEGKEFVGLIEFSHSVKDIKTELLKNGTQYMIIVDKSYLDKIPSKAGEPNKANSPVGSDGKYLASGKGATKFEITRKYLEILKDVNISETVEKGYSIQNGYLHVTQAIQDAKGRTVGHHIMSVPSGELETFLESNLEVVDQSFFAVLLATLITSLTLLLLVWTLLIRPTSRMEKEILESVDSSDLFKRVEVVGNNEIAQLGRAYNKQIGIIQHVINDVTSALRNIVAGDLDKEVKSNYRSDFGIVTDKLNQTYSGLRDTFNSINAVLGDLSKGELNNEHENHLSGEYYEILESAKNTMKDLALVFKDISDVVQVAARGNFDERIEIDSTGEFKVLIDAINESMINLSSSFDEIVNASQRMADGDFTQTIDKTYEYKIEEAKSAINTAMVDLSGVIRNVKEVAGQVRNSVQTVSEGTESLNNRTQEQAASLEQTSASMEETASQVEHNLNLAHNAVQASNEQTANLTDANEAMKQTQASMAGIKEASEQITNIISLIDSIAFQTNLLALNAAVEAARAGEHGRGFAVVAGEVRSLAGKSADAAKDIGGLISKTSEAIDGGVEKVEQVHKALDQINQGTAQVRETISQIEISSQEQAEGVKEVNRAITLIDSVTQENAALVERTYSTTEEMQEATGRLEDSVSKLKV